MKNPHLLFKSLMLCFFLARIIINMKLLVTYFYHRKVNRFFLLTIFIMLSLFTSSEIFAQTTPQWGTFTGNSTNDFGNKDLIDASGNVYVVTNTTGPLGYFPPLPASNRSQQPQDVFISKYSPTGTLLAVNYIGGAGKDIMQDIKIVGNSLCIVGTTSSTDFPITAGSAPATGVSYQPFVAKLNLSDLSLASAQVYGSSKSHFPYSLIDETGQYAYLVTGDLDNNGKTLSQRAIKVALSDLSTAYNVSFPYASPATPNNIGHIPNDRATFGTGFPFLKVTSGGNLVMAGKVADPTIPLTGIPASQYASSGRNLIMSLSPTGVPLMANYINGNGFISDIAVFGNEVAVAYPKDNDGTPFSVPFTPDAAQTTFGNAANKVLVSKFNTNTGAVNYSSLFGSNGTIRPYEQATPLFQYRSNGDLVMLMAEGANNPILFTPDAIVQTNTFRNGFTDHAMVVFSPSNQIKYVSGIGMYVEFAKLIDDDLVIGGGGFTNDIPVKNPIDPDVTDKNTGISIIDKNNKLVMGTRSIVSISDVVKDAAGNYNIVAYNGNSVWNAALTSDAFLSEHILGSQGTMLIRLNPAGTLLYGTGLTGGVNSKLIQQGSDLYVYGSAVRTTIVTQGEPRTTYDRENNNGGYLLKIICPPITNGGTVSPATQTVCQNAFVDKLISTNVTYNNPPVYIIEGSVFKPTSNIITTYQWQKSTDGGTTWIDIPGAIQSNYQPQSLTTTTLFHRIAIPRSCNSANTALITNDVTVTVTSDVAMNNLKPVYYVCPARATAIGETALAGATYTWTPATGLSAANVSNPTFTGSSNQTYVVDIIETNGCKARADVAVFVVQADAGPVSVSACQGQDGVKIGLSVPLVGSNVSYLWSPATGLSCTTCANPTAIVTSGSQGYTLKLNFTSSNGSTCTTTDDIEVSAVKIPVANPAGPDRGVCFNAAPVKLGTPQVAGYTYNWSPGFYLSQQANIAQPTSAMGSALSPVMNPIAYVLSINNNSGGCQFIDTVKVFQVTANAGLDGCVPRIIGSPEFAKGVLDGFGQPVKYAWTEVSTTGGTGYTLSCTDCAMPVVNTVGTDTAVVTYRLSVTWQGVTCTDDVMVYGCSGCPITSGITAESASGCLVATATSKVKLSVNVDPTYYNVVWSPATDLNTTTGNVVESSSTSPIEYTVSAIHKVTGQPSCSKSIKISQPGVSQPAFTAHNAAICPGVPVGIGETNTVGWSYSWTTDNSPAIISTSSNPSVAPLKTTTYYVTVKDNATGCTTKTKAIVTVDPVSEALAGTNANYCIGATVELGSPSVPNLTYSWSPTTGLSNANIAQPIATLSDNGPIAYTLIVSNANTGCIKNASVTFTKANPILPDLDPVTFCVGKSASIGYSAPMSGVTYAWSPATNLSCTNCANPIASPATTTTYTVTGTFSGGCTTQKMVTATVIIPTLNITASAFDCTQGFVLKATGTSTEYRWSLPVPSNIGFNNPVTVNTTTITTYKVIGTENGCVISGSIELTPPIIVNAGADRVICAGDQINIGVEGLIGTILWSVVSGDAGSIIGLKNTSTINVKPNRTTVYQIAITKDGCTRKDQVTVTVNSVAFDLLSTSTCQGSPVLFGPVANSNYIYQWSPTVGLSNSMIAQPMASPTATTYYKLTVTDKFTSCQLSKSAFVTVNQLPTALFSQRSPFCTGVTPNNNGRITLISATNTSKFGISTLGATNYNGPLYATATDYTDYTDNELIQFNIPNTGGAYIVRLFNQSNFCYKDTIITVAAVNCACNNVFAPTTTVTHPTCTLATGIITILDPISDVTYSFDDGVTYGTSESSMALASGTYLVKVKNTAGCESKASSVDIDPAPTSPVAPTTSVTQPTCALSTGIIAILDSIPDVMYSFDNGVTYGLAASSTALLAGTYLVKAAAGCESAATSVTINVAPSTPAAPTAAATQPTCVLATGVITVLDPISDVTYSFDNGVTYGTSASSTALSAGTYLVKVKNTAGCESVATSIKIDAAPNSPTAPTATATQPTCTLATGIITVSAPTSGVMYSFDNGVTYGTSASSNALAAGTYLVKVKNTAGCESVATSMKIDAAPNAPTAPTATATQPTCTLATGIITVSAPTSGVTYSFDNGVSYGTSASSNALAAGTYLVKVKNTAGCESMATSMKIDAAPNAPTAPTVSVTQPSCINNDGAINLTVIGAKSATIFIWSNGATTEDLSGLSAGTYTVTITDNFCTKILSYDLSIGTKNIIYDFCPGDTYKLEASNTGLTNIQWQLNGVNIAGATATSYVAKAIGVYTYTSNNIGGCAIGQCCPVELVAGKNCCKPVICLPVKLTRN